MRFDVLTVVISAAVIVVMFYFSGMALAQWEPVEGGLMTEWGEALTTEGVLEEYPRPQMMRKEWLNLNGLWDYAIRPRAEMMGMAGGDGDAEYDGQILVPFAVESALSGVGKKVGEDNSLWYRREFVMPFDWDYNNRVFLHFGAVDWETTVWVNGKEVGTHQGGYDAFSFDVSAALGAGQGGVHEIVVRVWDPTDAGYQPRGKQVREPSGIWYSAVTGIWQTVWLESVPRISIASLKMTPNLAASTISVLVKVDGWDESNAGRGGKVSAFANDKRIMVGRGSGARDGDHGVVEIKIRKVKLWSPEHPNLYGIQVQLFDGAGTMIDRVVSYFGMREITLDDDENGVKRLFLNGEALFHFGALDQGWWPDGLYTPASDAALRYDVQVMKDLGFNAVRKHVKRESARWYYHCDRLGLMVWQDMPSGDSYIGGNDADLVRSEESKAGFYREYQAMIDQLYNHPSVVVWVPFNEGWGQFETDEVIAWTKAYDESRLVDGPSGWTDRGSGDLHDLHRYPGPGMFPVESGRASVLGEFGGLGLPVEGHLWQERGNWGYRTFETTEALRARYLELVQGLKFLIGDGLAGAIYTQLSDVEGEVNGLMTYDRKVLKITAADVRALHAELYGPIQKVITWAETANVVKDDSPMWRYVFAEPGEGWEAGVDFDDSDWLEGRAGFGTTGTPGGIVQTVWDGSEIWLRRGFELGVLPNAGMGEVYWRIHHDEEVEVYLNGVGPLKLEGYTTGYRMIELSDEMRGALKAGGNVLAVHCKQTVGGQYVDVGLVELIEAEKK